MRVTIEIEDRTVQVLKEQAVARGLSLDEYLRGVAVGDQSRLAPSEDSSSDPARDFDRALDELFAGDSRSLPATRLTYRREEIYLAHD